MSDKLLKDWNWNKVISKRDELLWMDVDNTMEEVLMDYLDLDDLSDMTKELLDKANDLITFLDTSLLYNGATSPHFGSMESIVTRWNDQWWEGWKDYYG